MPIAHVWNGPGNFCCLYQLDWVTWFLLTDYNPIDDEGVCEEIHVVLDNDDCRITVHRTLDTDFHIVMLHDKVYDYQHISKLYFYPHPTEFVFSTYNDLLVKIICSEYGNISSGYRLFNNTDYQKQKDPLPGKLPWQSDELEESVDDLLAKIEGILDSETVRKGT